MSRSAAVPVGAPASSVPALREDLLVTLGHAAAALDDHGGPDAGLALGRAAQVIDRLIALPAPDHDGEAAARLVALYRYFADETAMVTRTRDRARLTRLTRLVAGVQAIAVHAADAARVSQPRLQPAGQRAWGIPDDGAAE